MPEAGSPQSNNVSDFGSSARAQAKQGAGHWRLDRRKAPKLSIRCLISLILGSMAQSLRGDAHELVCFKRNTRGHGPILISSVWLKIISKLLLKEAGALLKDATEDAQME